MNYTIHFVMFYAACISRISTIDTLLNFTSGLNLKTKVKEVVQKEIYSVQNVFVYYDDKTVVRYSNTFNAISTISLGSKVLSTFNVGSIDRPSYWGIVEGGNEILVIDINNNKNFSITNYDNLTHIQLLAYNQVQYFSSLIFCYQVLVFREDQFFSLVNSAINVQLVQNQKNYTTSGYRNFVDKVIRLQNISDVFCVVFTRLKEVHLVSYYLPTSIGFSIHIFSYHKMIIANLSTVNNNPIISYVVDKDQIVIIQFSDYDLYAFYMINGTALTIDVSLKNIIGTSKLKQVSPLILTNGQRTFLFTDKSIRVDLTNNIYSLLTVSHSGYTITNWTRMISLSSNFSFVYTLNDSKIYGFCSTKIPNMTLSTCQNSIASCALANCQTCNMQKTVCVVCNVGYVMINTTCHQMICDVADCLICPSNPICQVCKEGFNLYQTINLCINPNSSATNNQSIVSNSSNNSNVTMGNFSDGPLPPPAFQDATNSSYLNSTNSSAINDSNIISQNNSSTPTNPPQSTNQTSSNSTFEQGSNQSSNQINQTINNENVQEDSNQSSLIEENQSQINKTDQSLKYSPNKLIASVTNYWNQKIQNVNFFMKYLNSVPAVRGFFRFLTPMFGFFDDYWYYIYHNDSYPQLKILPSFLVFMYKISEDRIFGDYLHFNTPIQPQTTVHQNYLHYTNYLILEIDQQQTYFLKNIGQMLFEQYILAILLIFLTKVLIKVLKYCCKNYQNKICNNISSKSRQIQQLSKKNKNQLKNSKDRPKSKVILMVIQYLQSMVSFKGITLTLIGSNLIFISFYFSSQLRICFTFETFDMLSLILAFIFGFTMIGFTCFIYLYEDINKQIRQGCRKKNKRLMKEQKQLCVYETYFINLKSLLCGFVHGFFIESPMVQYGLLILIKFFLIYKIWSHKNSQLNNFIRTMVSIYYLSGFVIDVMCILSFQLIIPNHLIFNIVHDLSIVNFIEIVCLGILVVSLLAQILYEVYNWIIENFCSDDQPQQKSPQKNKKQIFKFARQIVPINVELILGQKISQKHNQTSLKNAKLRNQTFQSSDYLEKDPMTQKVFPQFHYQEKSNNIYNTRKTKIKLQKSNRTINTTNLKACLNIKLQHNKYQQQIESIHKRQSSYDLNLNQKPYNFSHFENISTQFTQIINEDIKIHEESFRKKQETKKQKPKGWISRFKLTKKQVQQQK